MLLARVVGNVWGARQAQSLEGVRLLVLRPLSARGRDSSIAAARAAPAAPSSFSSAAPVDGQRPLLEESGQLLVAVDLLGAGPGELVLVAHGSRCRDLTVGSAVAAKDVVVAIVDDAEVHGACGGGGAA